MKCDRCGQEIDAGQEGRHLGQTLCEDCLMNALSPARTCDPWAVHSAKRLAEEQGRIELSAVQQKIVEVLRQSGGMEPEELAERVGLKPDDLQREIAALRHMEKVRGELRGGRRLIRLW
jgi:hypothetical protein